MTMKEFKQFLVGFALLCTFFGILWNTPEVAFYVVLFLALALTLIILGARR